MEYYKLKLKLLLNISR